MLTGKNKKQFERFYYEKMIYSKWWSEDAFYSLPLSMQFGVIQDYADSIGYDVCTTEHRGLFMYLITKDPFDDWVEEFDYPTRKEARTAAIKAFDEIVNQK